MASARGWPMARTEMAWYLAAIIAGILVACTFFGCGYLSNDRYELIGCNKDIGLCKVFDKYQGVVENRSLPTTPAERGEKEVRKERWDT